MLSITHHTEKRPSTGPRTHLVLTTFLAGNALTLLSLNMLGLRDDLVAGGQRAAVKCLHPTCAFLSVTTLVSLLALLPDMVYLYVGLYVVAVVMAAAAGAHWYLRRCCTDGGGAGEAAAAASQDEKVELEAAWKISSCVTSSAFGGLVCVLFSSSKISGAVPAAAGRAAYAAMFFLFSTAIVGMFVMTVSKRVPDQITSRRLHIAAIKVANALLLCSSACAALAAAFAVLRYAVLAVFAPLVVTSVVFFLLRHCVTARGGRVAMAASLREDQIKAVEDVASKVMVLTLGGIMTVLGGWLADAEKDDHGDKWGAVDMFMVVLTSAFVSSFGFMVLAAAPGSARERLAPVGRVLMWSTVALFVTTAVSVYGVEVSSGVKP